MGQQAAAPLPLLRLPRCAWARAAQRHPYRTVRCTLASYRTQLLEPAGARGPPRAAATLASTRGVSTGSQTSRSGTACAEHPHAYGTSARHRPSPAAAAAACRLQTLLSPPGPVHKRGPWRAPESDCGAAMSKKNNQQTRARMHAARVESERAVLGSLLLHLPACLHPHSPPPAPPSLSLLCFHRAIAILGPQGSGRRRPSGQPSLTRRSSGGQRRRRTAWRPQNLSNARARRACESARTWWCG